MRKLLLFITVFSLATAFVKSQTDNLFWFGAPDISSVHGDAPQNGAPINLHITAVQATDVTISRPADPAFVPITFHLDVMEHQSINVNGLMTIDRIETYPQAWPLAPGDQIQGKGFKITSTPGDITAYWEYDQYWNRDILPLKGKNALGTDFWVGTNNAWENGNYGGTAYSGFVVTATENNTTIIIDQNKAWLYFPVAPAVRTITLNAGETFCFRSLSTTAALHMNGVHVQSDKNIVITGYDDSVRKRQAGAGTSYDLCADQIVPTSIIGMEYLVMKGFLDFNAADGRERVFIMATQPNTQVRIDGVLVTTLVNAGDIYNYQIANPYIKIVADKPVYVNHFTGFGGEMGGAILPKIDGCTGSHDVTFTRTPNPLDAFYLNIMVRNDTVTGSPNKNQSINFFTLTVNGTTVAIPAAYFQYITDSTWAILRHIPAADAFFTAWINPGDEVTVSNAYSRFHLGVINGGSGTGCKYGYFSDYKEQRGRAGIGGSNASPQATYCNLDPIHLVATGGIRYKWRGITNPADTNLLSSTVVADPYFYPVVPGNYLFEVRITRECFIDTTIRLRAFVLLGPVADFTFSDHSGCSVFEPLIINSTDTTLATSMLWNFDTRYNTLVDQDTISNPFTWSFPPNTTDTVQSYNVRLTAKGMFGMCPDSRDITIQVKPGITAAFTPSLNSGCADLTVDFSNNAVGNTINSYYWDFGDNTQSLDSAVTKTFENETDTTIDYNVWFRVGSTFNCVDSTSHIITVHPRVYAEMVVPPYNKCSPMSVDIDPSNSHGVDTFYWTLSGAVTQNLTDITYTPLNISYTDNTQVSPDTIWVDMIGINEFGCRDTATTRQIVAKPIVVSSFTADNHIICDSVPVLFTNNSTFYKTQSYWSFGDGTQAIDTVLSPYNHLYRNFNLVDTRYPVSLAVVSSFECSDTSRDTITVHPFIRADFSIDKIGNCSPLDVNFYNYSGGAITNYNWDFGDSQTSTSSAGMVSHHYVNTSMISDVTYNPTLIVSRPDGCADTVVRSILLHPMLAAAFNYTDSVGCNPLTVSIQNNSIGNINLYHWDFGDTTSSSTSAATFTKNYSHLQPVDATFNITLTVIDPYGCDSTIVKPVTVYSYIQSLFTVPNHANCSPFIVTPENQSPAGVNRYYWDYEGDGVTDNTIQSPAITYTNTSLVARTDTLRLIVQNFPHLCYDTMQREITVYPALDVNYTRDANTGCHPLLVNFTNNTNIIPGTIFTWDFDDGSTSSMVDTSHLFINLNHADVTYNVALYGMSQYGCRDTFINPITVYRHIDAGFSVSDPYLCHGEATDLIDVYGLGATNWAWNFGDGQTYSGQWPPAHTYYNAYTDPTDDTLDIRLISSFGAGNLCPDTIIHQIVVHPEVRAIMTPDKFSGCHPLDVLFSNTTFNATPGRWEWDFGDGRQSSAQTPPVHPFFNDTKSNVTYNVHLLAINDVNECQDDTTIQITVNANPDAQFDLFNDITSACAPYDARIINTTSQVLDYPNTYSFDFGDGNSTVVFNKNDVYHTYDNLTSGNALYTLKLTVTAGTTGCTDSTYETVSIHPHVIANFTPDITQGCSPQFITFTNSSLNSTDWDWNFDDGNISNDEDPRNNFFNNTDVTQVFDVKMDAYSNYGCHDDTIQQITIWPQPNANFWLDRVSDRFPSSTFSVDNQTGLASSWTYTWDWGDSTGIVNDFAPQPHTYGYWGDYTVTMRVSNTYCWDTLSKNLTIYPALPIADFVDSWSGCAPLQASFSDASMYGNELYWIYDNQDTIHRYSVTSDEDRLEPTGHEFDYTFTEVGSHQLTLKVVGDGGSAFHTETIEVYEIPNVNFEIAPDSVILPYPTIKCFNMSASGNDETYLWTFQDGENTATSGEFIPTYTYTTKMLDEDVNEENWTVTLLVTEPNGCDSSLTKEVNVRGGHIFQMPNAFFPDLSGPSSTGQDDPNYTEADKESSKNTNIFYPYHKFVIKYNLEIYNRWGIRIFETNNIYRGWDGYYTDGKLADQGVYIWKATVTFSDGLTKTYSGDVTLLIGDPPE